MDVHSVYLGSGDGPSSFLRYPLKKLNNFRSSSDVSDTTGYRARSADQNINTERSDSDGASVGLAKSIWAILLAREKQKKRRRATRARNRGMIVLMDRYPQNQFEDINDGPLLQAWTESNSRVLNKIARWERDIYKKLDENSPDLIIKLATDPEVAKSRKPETPMSNLRKKADIIDTLEYKNSRVVTVDTHNDIEKVINEIKKQVWAEI
jgi:hypothetical protein